MKLIQKLRKSIIHCYNYQNRVILYQKNTKRSAAVQYLFQNLVRFLQEQLNFKSRDAMNAYERLIILSSEAKDIKCVLKIMFQHRGKILVLTPAAKVISLRYFFPSTKQKFRQSQGCDLRSPRLHSLPKICP